MKLGIPKGTRDFEKDEILKRRYIIATLQKHFECQNFSPLETPSFENLETLMGKYGDEGDRLVFKILNSGDFLSKVSDENLSIKDSKKLTPQISEKALRYDLTVPFARYVAMNQGKLTFPFKRYQIQPVWRADRPQRGRFREFYQCDADIIGTRSLLSEVNLVMLYDSVFTALKLPVTIHVNNRKILAGIAEYAGIENQLIDFTVALDKLDKLGLDKVVEEMKSKNISDASIEKLLPIIKLEGGAQDKIAQLKELLANVDIAIEGIKELEYIFTSIDTISLSTAKLNLNLTLARGLNYYTGAIFEVTADDVEMGSIGGGGRYDNLTEIFGVKDISGVGISFGLDRIYLVLEELNLFPEETSNANKILFFNFGEEGSLKAMKILKDLRTKNIACELYPEEAKLQKQFKYAENNGINFVIFYGEEEQKNNTLTIKNIISGKQQTISPMEIESWTQTN